MVVLSTSSWPQGNLRCVCRKAVGGFEPEWETTAAPRALSCVHERVEAEPLGRRCFHLQALLYPVGFWTLQCSWMFWHWKTPTNVTKGLSKLFEELVCHALNRIGFTDIVQLEMLWISARDRIKMEWWPWLGMSRTLYEQCCIIKPGWFPSSWDKVHKRRKTSLCWIKLISQKPRETCWGEIQTRGDITKCWCHKAPGWVMPCLSLVTFLLSPHFYQYRNTGSSSDIFHLHFWGDKETVRVGIERL